MATAKELKIIIDGETIDLQKAMDDAGKSVEGFGKKTEKTSGMFGKLGQSIKGMLPVLGLGAAVAGGKALVDMQHQLKETRKQVQQLTGATGDMLSDLTSDLQATANTFGVDFNEMTIATNNFAQQMGIDLSEAIKLVQDGFIAGADAGGEFLNQLKEYGPAFKEAGLEADEAIALMTQSVQQGIFADKGADVIKEGTLRLREMTQSTRDALEGIGISSVEMEKKLRSGQITYFQAMQQVSKKLGELEAQSPEVGTAIADIFGGPGEDAGLQYLKTLDKMTLSLADLKDQAGETGAQQQRLLDAETRLQKQLNEQFGEGADLTIEFKIAWKNFVAEIMPLLKQFLGFLEKFILPAIKQMSNLVGDIVGGKNSLFNRSLEEVGAFGEAKGGANVVKNKQGSNAYWDRMTQIAGQEITNEMPSGTGTGTGTSMPTLVEMPKEAKSNIDDLNRELERMEDELINIGTAAEQADVQFTEFFDEGVYLAEEMNNVLANTINSFSDSLVDAIANGESFGEAFSNIMQQMLIDIGKVILKTIILNALMSAFGGGAGSIFTGAGGRMTGVKAFATGGMVTSPTLATIGEREPEMIIPMSKMGGMQQEVIVKGQIGNNVIELSNREGANTRGRIL